MKLIADNETIRAMNGSRNGEGFLPAVLETGSKNHNGAQQSAEPRLAEVLIREQASSSWKSISRISRRIVPKGDI